MQTMRRQDDRLLRIIHILRENNGASVRQLSGLLGVTEMTVRRDLEKLKDNNIVNLVHGAAIYNPDADLEEGSSYHILRQTGVKDSEKRRIGKAAAALIEEGDVIFVDVGTTTVHVLENLPAGHSVTVTCFTMNALQAAMKQNVETLVMGGGLYHPNTQFFESIAAIQMIENMRATKAFLSAAGVSSELGLTCIDKYEAPSKRACINSALEKILMVDSSKFGVIKPTFFSELNEIDTIVTDRGISSEWEEILRERNIRLILA